MLFFGSGFCALVYETVWVRQRTLSYGISVYAVSAVLTSFMFGLCAGAYLLGKFPPKNPLKVYGIFELIISLYAFVLYFLLSDFLPMFYSAGYHLLPDIPYVLNFVRFIVTFFLLAIPTTLMGGTLPILTALLKNKDKVGSSIALLYGLNTLASVSTKEAVPSLYQRVQTKIKVNLILLVLFLSGYTALSYEIIWNRTLLLYTQNSTYAFSSILIVFLLGISIGSLLFSHDIVIDDGRNYLLRSKELFDVIQL